CHGHFRATNEDNDTPFLRDVYISPTDGQPWSEIYQEVTASEPEEEIGLHDIHRHIMLDKLSSSRCNVCHTRPVPGFYPVSLNSSSTTDLEPISCVGCHGRYEDMGNDGISAGLGAGLRQHHTNAGITECKTCHEDADPANYTPVGENVPPPFYFTPDAEFPNKPTNACNSNGEEDYAGGWQGLDNDGDGIYDVFDPDCRPLARRIEVCHVWQRGDRAGQTRNITVSRRAVRAHLRHGDTLGPCRETLTQH
ncbi:MAG TPA: hypothetical protein VLS27_14240, partial [Gammaproteobacteria bacterium]|nr:hypothetical protein [Gammaproteobacteria bacterium]